MMLAENPILLIHDADFSCEVYDVAALAVVHSLENCGCVRIQAMIISSGNP